MSGLAGQVGVITGATSGVGRAVALALAREGTQLALVGRSAEALRTVDAEVAKAAARVRTYCTDLTIDSEVRDLARRVESDFDRLDLLVHCAGVIAVGPLEAAPVEQFDWQYQTNLRAPYLLTQLLLPRLRAGQGQIVFLNSTAGLRVPSGTSQYSATKHGLKAMADALRDEVNADGVRVLTLFLGRTATRMQAQLHEIADKPYAPERFIQPDHIAEMLISLLRLPKSAEVTDVIVRPMMK